MDTEKLQERVELMRRCYFKEFTSTMVSITWGCGNYLDMKNGLDGRDMLRKLDLIEGHYFEIPFDELDSNDEDFAPLFEVRGLLREYGELVRRFLNESSFEIHNELGDLQGEIADVGEHYRVNFQKRIGELRSISGYENYDVTLVRYDGQKYGM